MRDENNTFKLKLGLVLEHGMIMDDDLLQRRNGNKLMNHWPYECFVLKSSKSYKFLRDDIIYTDQE